MKTVSAAQLKETSKVLKTLEKRYSVKDALRELLPEVERAIKEDNYDGVEIYEKVADSLNVSPDTVKTYINDLKNEAPAKPAKAASSKVTPIGRASGRKKTPAARRKR